MVMQEAASAGMEVEVALPSYEDAQAKLQEAAGRLGRAVKVFVREATVRHTPATTSVSAAAASGQATARDNSNDNDDDDAFYEFTVADYARVSASHKEEKFLKPRNVRDRELQERKSRITKAVIRVQFPDGYVVEAEFAPTDTVEQVRQLVQQCIRDPNTPFYFFTAPPKRRIADEAQDLYTAQLAPGALIYFTADDASRATPPSTTASTAASSGAQQTEAEGSDLLPTSHLRQDVCALRNLHMVAPPQATAHDDENMAGDDGADSKRSAEGGEDTSSTADKGRAKAKQHQRPQKNVPKWFKR